MDTRILRVVVTGNSASARAAMTGLGTSAVGMSRGVTTAGTAVEKTHGKVGKLGGGLGAMAGKMGGGLAAALGLTFGLHELFKGTMAAIESASALQKAQERVNAIFGRNAGVISTWAEGAATSLGLSKSEAESAAAAYGMLGKNAGFTGKDLVSMSEKTTKLAVDLAAFKHVAPETAVEALRKALAGNFRGLKQFNLQIDASSVKQQALKMHLIKSNKDALTPHARQLATLALIYKQTGDAQGAFSRHTNDLAEKQKILHAQIENVKEKIGAALLPVMLKLVTFISGSVVPNLNRFVQGITGVSKSSNAFVIAGKVIRGVIQGIVIFLRIWFIFIRINIMIIRKEIQIWAIVMQWLYHAVIFPVFNAIRISVMTVVNTFRNILIPAAVAVGRFFQTSFLNGIVTALHAVGGAFTWLYHTIVLPVFNAIKTAVRVAVTVIHAYIWLWIAYVNAIGRVLHWLYLNVCVPVFNAIKAAIRILVAVVKAYIWLWIAYINAIGRVIVWLLRNIVIPIYNGIKTATAGVRNFIVGQFNNVIGFFGTTVPKAFRKFVGFMASIWHLIEQRIGSFGTNVMNFFIALPGKVLRQLKNLANLAFVDPMNWIIKYPINMAVGNVWRGLSAISGGLIPGWHDVKTIGHFRSGGMVQGPGTPTSDSILARVSRDEYIVNAASTQKHLGLLEAINSDSLMIPGFARGGRAGAVWPSIVAFARSIGAMAGLRVTSTTGGRHAAGSYHYSGMAVDVAGSASAMNNAAAKLYRYGRYFLEMFHSPHWFIKNGRPSRPIDFATHFNHIHMAMSRAGASAALHGASPGAFLSSGGPGGLPGILGTVWNFIGGAKGFFSNTLGGWVKKFANKSSLIGRFLGKAMPGVATGLGQTILNKLTDFVSNFINKAAVSAFNVLSGGSIKDGGVGAFMKNMQRAGVPATWWRDMSIIASHESSYNPHAHNPSGASGLMQLLPSTFRSYHVPGTSGNIYDPVANIAASANYIRRRYGNPHNTPWFHGGHWYDNGGWLEPGVTMAMNGTGKRERISAPGETGGGPAIILNVTFEGPVLGERDFVKRILPTLREEVIKATRKNGGTYLP